MKYSIRVSISLVFVFLMVSVVYAPPITIGPIEETALSAGESWLDGWTYRKSHVISGATGAGTDYQVKIITEYEDGADSGDTVYLREHSQTDFDDVRFTDDDGITLLDYWLQESTPSDVATFWVEVQDSLETDVTIFVYYGNSTVSSASSGANTFILFDDFDDPTLDAGIWTETGTGSYGIASSIITITSTATSYKIESNDQYSDPRCVGFLGAYVADLGQAAEYENFGFYNSTAGDYDYVSSYGVTGDSYVSYDTGSEVTNINGLDSSKDYEIFWYEDIGGGGSSWESKLYQEGALVATHNTEVTNTNKHVFFMTDGANEGPDDWLKIDTIYVRKIARDGDEPTNGEWGVEYDEDGPTIRWREVGEATLYLERQDPVLLWGLDVILVLGGLIAMPLSAMFLSKGIRDKTMSTDKLLIFLIIFMVGLGLFVGGIMP